MKKIIKYLNETIKKEKYLVIFNVCMFLIGLIIGSLFINFITKDDKSLLIEQVLVYLDNIKRLSTDVFGINAFIGDFLNNIVQLVFIFIFGISMIGILFVIFLLFFKGFMLGTTVSIIIFKYGIKGILVALLYVFPSLVLNIIIYIFMSFFAINASIKFIKALLKKDKLDFRSFFGKYLLSFFISILFIGISSLLNVFLTPLLLKLVTYIS